MCLDEGVIMVNEERVKSLYKLALYEKTEEKEHRQTGRFYRSDYIGKEMIVSIFTGTIAYVLMALLWVMTDIEEILRQVNSLEIINTVIIMIAIYVGFMAVYLFATFLVYLFRYTRSRKRLETYKENLKAVNQIYEREEKLKL